MRIACLTRLTNHHRVFGGMERHLTVLAAGLVAAGHQVEIFTTGHPDGHRLIEEGGFITHFLPTPPARYRHAWMTASRQAIREAAGRFDIIWGEGAAAEGVARLPIGQRPPLVSILHGTFLGERLTRLQQRPTPRLLALAALMRWRQQYWRAHIEQAAGLIAVSEEVKSQVISFARVTEQDVDVVVNGVDILRFQVDQRERQHQRARLGVSDQDVLFVHLSRLEKEKGAHLGIEALQKLTDSRAHLLIIGQGSQLESLKAQAAAAGLGKRVQTIGFVPNENVPTYLAAADVFILPSLAKEGLPISILEGMAAGRPIVATDVGGIAGAIDHGQTGFLFTCGDVSALAYYMNLFLEDPDKIERFGESGRRKAAAEFAVEVMIQRTEQIFKRIVVQNNSRVDRKA